jgi:hypothetical protein
MTIVREAKFESLYHLIVVFVKWLLNATSGTNSSLGRPNQIFLVCGEP